MIGSKFSLRNKSATTRERLLSIISHWRQTTISSDGRTRCNTTSLYSTIQSIIETTFIQNDHCQCLSPTADFSEAITVLFHSLDLRVADKSLVICRAVDGARNGVEIVSTDTPITNPNKISLIGPSFCGVRIPKNSDCDENRAQRIQRHEPGGGEE